MRTLTFGILATVLSLHAADSAAPILWTNADMAKLQKDLAGKMDPAGHLGSTRPTDSVLIVHRDGPSEAEIHEKEADFIVMKEGEGTILVGGTLLESRVDRPTELRGKPGTGGKMYSLKAGDMLYVPANTVHQFLVAPGKAFTAVIVKITPVR
jgi:mannose-6-phosphate isomerase-like protein (cupin superfamily)